MIVLLNTTQAARASNTKRKINETQHESSPLKIRLNTCRRQKNTSQMFSSSPLMCAIPWGLLNRIVCPCPGLVLPGADIDLLKYRRHNHRRI